MTLLEEDMKRIEALGFQREEFAWFDGNFWRLRNVNGHCVFFDPQTRLCKIYPYRPVGCRLYPLIYVEGEGPRVDVLCPNHHTYTEEEMRRNAPLLLRAVRQLFREAGKQLSS